MCFWFICQVDFKMNGISAIVVLYKPDFSLLENIASYYESVKYIFLWRNSSIDDKLIEQLNKHYHDKIVWCGDGCNKGIGYPLNNILSRAKDAGSEWLLTIDQDSCFHSDSFDLLSKEIGDVEPNVAIVAANHIVNNQPTHAENENPEWVMMSGNLINIDFSLCYGGFNEPLFIDGVDIEFCRRLKSKGFKIKVCLQSFLKHNLGDAKNVKVLGYNTVTTNHNAIRLYYIYRNYPFLILKNKTFSGIRLLLFKFLLHKLICVLFLEKNKSTKLKMMVKGLFHFLINKFGALT